MLRAVTVVGLILTLLVVAVFGPQLLRTDAGDGAATASECNLMAGPCSWSDDAGEWQVELEVVAVDDQGTEYQLTVASPEQPERFLAVLRGESMYMGEYPVPLRRKSDGQYLARFTAPICSTGTDMRWRIDLQEGQDPVSGVPVKMVFPAHNQ